MTEFQKQQKLKRYEEQYANSSELQEQFVSPKAYANYKIVEEQGLVKTAPAKSVSGPAHLVAPETPIGAAAAKDQAAKEWAANLNGVRSSFASEAAYIGFRSAQLQGRVK